MQNGRDRGKKSVHVRPLKNNLDLGGRVVWTHEWQNSPRNDPRAADQKASELVLDFVSEKVPKPLFGVEAGSSLDD